MKKERPFAALLFLAGFVLVPALKRTIEAVSGAVDGELANPARS